MSKITAKEMMDILANEKVTSFGGTIIIDGMTEQEMDELEIARIRHNNQMAQKDLKKWRKENKS